MFRGLNQINFISKNFNLTNVIFKVGNVIPYSAFFVSTFNLTGVDLMYANVNEIFLVYDGCV
jgi:hypothetical protein